MLIKPTPISYWENRPASNKFITGIQLRAIRFNDLFLAARNTPIGYAASCGIVNALDNQHFEFRWETEKELELVCL